jgi:hypothetical protein
MQPTYLPWCGYFALILRADKFVFLDDVEFDRRSWQSRNRISLNGKEFLLSLPVSTAGKGRQLIHEIEIVDSKKACFRHLQTIQRAYRKLPLFDKVFPFLENTYNTFLNNGSNSLITLNTSIIRSICDYLEINSQFYFSSQLSAEGLKSERLSNIVTILECDTYLSPQNARAYIEEEKKFALKEISVKYQKFESYPYHYKEGSYLPNLSIIDILFRQDSTYVLDYLNKNNAFVI